jgi:hypothetical protein
MITLLTTKIDERTTPAELESIRRNLADALRELQGSTFARVTTVKDVALADGVSTPIPHRLGVAAFAIPSPVRGASTSGRIEEVRDTQYDRSLFIVLRATGYGATVTVDVKAVPL